mgnify:CR=1 FL=1
MDDETADNAVKLAKKAGLKPKVVKTKTGKNVSVNGPMNKVMKYMQSLPEDVFDAAKIDGASPFQQFYYISLPFLVGIISILFLLRFIWTFNKFDDIFHRPDNDFICKLSIITESFWGKIWINFKS